MPFLRAPQVTELVQASEFFDEWLQLLFTETARPLHLAWPFSQNLLPNCLSYFPGLCVFSFTTSFKIAAIGPQIIFDCLFQPWLPQGALTKYTDAQVGYTGTKERIWASSAISMTITCDKNQHRHSVLNSRGTEVLHYCGI